MSVITCGLKANKIDIDMQHWNFLQLKCYICTMNAERIIYSYIHKNFYLEKK